ncbi:ABC transporter permease [Microvirga sp. 2YAF29]|uniref:ABC transporter permease n=1 Tax=Microvirga sp. 2YAF29 TaxID=3233031 RepID=UPI003F9615D2
MAYASVSRRRLFGSLELVLGAILAGGMALATIASPLLFPDGGESMDLMARLLPPFQDPAHLLGTDPLGRDMLARVVVGGKISLTVGLVSMLGSTILGTLVGLFAGYYRGIAETLLMRFTDVQLALPFILVAIMFLAVLGTGVDKVIAIMIITQWVQYARLVRGSVLALREREFILSARAIGVGSWRIIFTHILPNVLGPIVILMTLNVADNILLESSLTFIGLGVDPLIPSWGGMLADGRTYLQSAWWVSVFPGLAIMFTVLGLNLLGDWLRDYLDPTGQTSK